MVTPRRGLGWQVTVATAAMLATTYSLSAWPGPAPARALPAGLDRVGSGLAMADHLTRDLTAGQLEDAYSVNGSAGPHLGWVYEDAAGLRVGIEAHRGWAGWFAETIHAAGPRVAWHTVVLPAALRPGAKGRGIAVFAVQTATTQTSGVINYIVVAAVSRGPTYRWIVGYAHGVVAGAATDVLWTSPWHAVPAGPDLPGVAVTVITDGRHRLAVWLGGTEVFHSDHLRLRIPAPFQAYLEVQSSGPSYSTRFQDFWVADDAPLRIEGLLPGQTATLLTSGGRRFAAAVAGTDGTASLHLPGPRLEGTATLAVGVGSGAIRVYRALSYAGGDVIRLNRR